MYVSSVSPHQPGKPRLLVLTSTFPRWPADSEPAFVHALSQRLTPTFEVHLLAPHAAGAALEETMDGVRVHRFRYAPTRWQTLTYQGGILARLRQNKLRFLLIPLFLVAQARAIRRLLTQYDITHIHSHWIIPQTLSLRLALLGLGVSQRPAVLCTSHGGDLFGLQAYGMAKIKRWALQCCDAMTVVSCAMQEQAHRLAPHLVPAIIPMGTFLARHFTPDARTSHTPRETQVVLFVGRLVEKKGVPHLLDAIAQIAPAYPQLQLWIAGHGPDEAALQARAQYSDLRGRVHFLGGVAHEQLPDLYRRASVTVVPSVIAESGDQEGFGLVIVEAMGCACPVIVSDLPAIRDIVSEEGLALRVPAGDVSALAAALKHTLDDPAQAQQRAHRARLHVQERFDWESIAAEYSRLLLTMGRQ